MGGTALKLVPTDKCCCLRIWARRLSSKCGLSIAATQRHAQGYTQVAKANNTDACGSNPVSSQANVSWQMSPPKDVSSIVLKLVLSPTNLSKTALKPQHGQTITTTCGHGRSCTQAGTGWQMLLPTDLSGAALKLVQGENHHSWQNQVGLTLQYGDCQWQPQGMVKQEMQKSSVKCLQCIFLFCVRSILQSQTQAHHPGTSALH